MKKRKLTLPIICFVTLLFKSHGLLAQSNILYSQKVLWDNWLTAGDKFNEMLHAKHIDTFKGSIILTEDSLLFVAKRKDMRERLNFAVSYSSINTIETYYGYLLPNSIQINYKEGKNFKSFRVFTYIRRKIIRMTRERMKVANQRS